MLSVILPGYEISSMLYVRLAKSRMFLYVFLSVFLKHHSLVNLPKPKISQSLHSWNHWGKLIILSFESFPLEQLSPFKQRFAWRCSRKQSFFFSNCSFIWIISIHNWRHVGSPICYRLSINISSFTPNFINNFISLSEAF